MQYRGMRFSGCSGFLLDRRKTPIIPFFSTSFFTTLSSTFLSDKAGTQQWCYYPSTFLDNTLLEPQLWSDYESLPWGNMVNSRTRVIIISRSRRCCFPSEDVAIKPVRKMPRVKKKEKKSSVRGVAWHSSYKNKTLLLEFPILPWGNDLLLLHNYGLWRTARLTATSNGEWTS